ncbi:hypothetical protein BDY17DRAFT_78906 [Neohortaea acidophila]|uniref:Tat pathway signal sequence n=1 Tax=Neohortaea acidophila TaxID=245834 RepID=A0A6A6Q353_9PEZI|nr:uncharacterized protein BDY17DRAFT_78906 [Neohortaea acidophila]KAF2486434.1 hypothetical protein BDY17DRAFT_78906 [Neohortaea acidophila]
MPSTMVWTKLESQNEHWGAEDEYTEEQLLDSKARLQRSLKRARRWMLVLGLLSFVLAAVLLAPSWIRGRRWDDGKRIFDASAARKEVVFDEEPMYMAQNSDAAWEALTPSHGLVNIPSANGTRTVYGVSMYHQLHCLNNIRKFFWTTQVEDKPTDDVHSAHVADIVHIVHCFDYIRQGIMCAGDTTLESPARRVPLAAENARSPIDGSGISHSCADYGAIEAYMQTHGAYPKEL